MAPFSKRQIGYIKAVAGVGQHKSFINYFNRPITTSVTNLVDTTTTDGEYTHAAKLVQQPSQAISPIADSLDNFDSAGKKLSGALFCLNNIPLAVDHTDAAGDINDQVLTQLKFAKALTPNKMLMLTQNSYSEGVEGSPPTSMRIGEDFYLESTHLRWRFTMPDFSVASGKQPHHEYRFIVFRQRKPTLQRDMNPTGDHAQWLNFNYDLFAGHMGRRVGWSGFRRHQEFDGNEEYQSGSATYRLLDVSQNQKLTTDDVLTMPLNDADYVIMRDERFFLGAEHGKSHYETVTRFDWSDPGSTVNANMIDGLDDGKNYDWWFLILGTTNDSVSPNLNISVRGTTAVTSA